MIKFMNINYLQTFIITFIFVVFSVNIAQSQVNLSDSGLIFILDNSGSMAEVINGDTKLNSAKNALNQALGNKKLDSLNIGLLEIGGHCEVKELVSPSLYNRQNIIKASNNIHSRPYLDASTPIAESIHKASKILEKYQGEKRIVLVSDGGANCQGEEEFPLSACDMVASLKNQGIDFSLNLIGYGAKDDKEFECIANLSDNYSFDSPNNPEELKKDVSKTTNPQDFIGKHKSLIVQLTGFITSLEGFIKAIMALIATIVAFITASFLGKKQNKSSDNGPVEKW